MRSAMLVVRRGSGVLIPMGIGYRTVLGVRCRSGITNIEHMNAKYQRKADFASAQKGAGTSEFDIQLFVGSIFSSVNDGL